MLNYERAHICFECVGSGNSAMLNEIVDLSDEFSLGVLIEYDTPHAPAVLSLAARAEKTFSAETPLPWSKRSRAASMRAMWKSGRLA